MKSKLFLFLIVIFSVPVIYHLFSPGFFLSDDGEWMIIRLSAFYQALADGQFPPRFLERLNFGYGYPVANFLYPGFMYLGVPIHVLGFGFVTTVKIILGLSMIFSGIFAFLWFRKFFSDFSSFVGSVVYVYAPYHLYDLWVRGSIGEILALAVAPFILWQVERKSTFWISAGIALLIISHNTLAAMFLSIVLLIMILNIFLADDKKETVYKFMLAGVFGVGMSSFFWLPAIFELRYVIFNSTEVSDWRNYFADISLIGATIISVFPISLFLLLLNRRFQKHRLAVVIWIIGALSLFLAIPQGSFIWEVFPVSFVQFPFRFLSITILCAAFLTAFITSLVPGKTKIAFGVIFIILTLFFSSDFLAPSQKFDKGESYYITNEATTTVKNEYMPKWVESMPTQRFEEKVIIIDGEGSIDNLVYNNKATNFSTEGNEQILVRINTIYYPGWKSFVNKRPVEITYENEYGVMEIVVPSGSNEVELVFQETPIRFTTNIISLIAFIGLIIYSGRNRITKFIKK